MKKEQILDCITTVINDRCTSYATFKMDKNDWILLSDSHHKDSLEDFVTKYISHVRYTIKRSCEEKYNKFYDEKFEEILYSIVK